MAMCMIDRALGLERRGDRDPRRDPMSRAPSDRISRGCAVLESRVEIGNELVVAELRVRIGKGPMPGRSPRGLVGMLVARWRSVRPTLVPDGAATSRSDRFDPGSILPDRPLDEGASHT